MVNQKSYELGSAPSVIRKLFAYGLEKKKEVGEENVYDFSIGNPSIPSPKKVNDTIIQQVLETDSLKLHGYSMAAGFEDVRDAVAYDLKNRFDTDITAGNLFFTCGAAPAIVSVLRALTLNSETDFIVPAPYFPEYKVFAESGGARLTVLPADIPSFQIDLDALEKAVTPHTQGVIINSPNNPSGVVYTEETIKGIASVLQKKESEYGHPIYIIADEPYRELVYDGVSVPFIPHFYKDTIVCYSWSKSLSLPGERIGYVLVPDQVTEKDRVYAAVAGAARAIGHVCPPSLMQRVVGICVTEKPDLKAYEENRSLLYESLKKMGYECAKPDGAFYLFVKAPNGDADAFSEKAKLTHNLLVVPGAGFGCPSYFRLSYCVANDMIKRSLPAFEKMFAVMT